MQQEVKVKIEKEEESSCDTCYCKQEKEGSQFLVCDECKRSFHIECLRNGMPSLLAGDVYFNLTCAECGENGEEECSRKNLSWLQVVYISIYNLHLSGKGRQGFFRWKEDICTFIKTNWTTLFHSGRKPTANWPSTVAGVLSVNCPRYFVSGSQEIHENGWWALKECIPPKEKLSEAPTGKKRGGSGSKSYKRRRHLYNIHTSETLVKQEKQTAGHSRADAQLKTSPDPGFSMPEETLFSSEVMDPLFEPLSEQPLPSIFDDFLPPDSAEINVVDDDLPLPSDILEFSEHPERKQSDAEEECDDNESVRSEHAESVTTQSDISSATDSTRDNNTNNKHNKQKSAIKKTDITQETKIVPLSVHQEKELLYQLNELPQVLHHDAAARRLRRKLIVRQTKRDRGLPIFDLDKFMSDVIKHTSHYEVTKSGEVEPVQVSEMDTSTKENEEVSKTEETPLASPPPVTKNPGSLQTSFVASRESCVLDRFQVSFSDLPRTQQQPTSFLQRLVGGGPASLPQTIISPYTSRKLKAFIRRDYETRPRKLNLLQEIIAHPHRNDPSWKPPEVSPIDYCYVSPHHIPSVNAMCREFFWPGIDLSECLKYPDFSCVVLYKKLVIGFAFMVPDVKYNEAYISFILVHPDWRRAGICSYMLYHLIQTCLGKDVTLHVSATNPAMLLYQKFCFKPEELVLDFYSKYLPETSNECRHAYFLRLRR